MSSPTYSGEVLEAATPGTVVLTVSAMDLDQVLRADNQQILDSYWEESGFAERWGRI